MIGQCSFLMQYGGVVTIGHIQEAKWHVNSISQLRIRNNIKIKVFLGKDNFMAQY